MNFTVPPRAVDWVGVLTIGSVVLLASQPAHAHGIAGNRFFPGTLTFDDPAVADEAIIPNLSYWNHPDGGGHITDNRINYSFTRLLTPTVGVFIDNSWIARNWGVTQRFGFRRHQCRDQMGGLSKQPARDVAVRECLVGNRQHRRAGRRYQSA